MKKNFDRNDANSIELAIGGNLADEQPTRSGGVRKDLSCEVQIPRNGKRQSSKLEARSRALGILVQDLEPSELLGYFIARQQERGAVRASQILDEVRLEHLSRVNPAELLERFGLSAHDSIRVAAAFEIGRRVLKVEREASVPCSSAAQVFRVLEPQLAGLERERFLVLLLDGKHRLRRIEQVSEGTLTTSLVHPREVFKAAIREASAAIIAVHNHPSGDPEPSPEDLEVTRRLRRAGRLIGIPLLDHVVIGKGRYVSLRERLW